MSSYLIGNLVGRLLASYLIVWVVNFAFARFDWRLTFKRTHQWYGWLAVIVVFVLGMAGSMTGQGIP